MAPPCPILDTPLHVCVLKEFHEGIPLLLKFGGLSTLNRENNANLTPIEMARNKNMDLKKLGLSG